MSGLLVVTAINIANEQFQRLFRKLPPNIQKEAKSAISLLIFVDILNPPARLHLHSLTSKEVKSRLDETKKVKVYTIHLSSDDNYKASFTFEGGTAFFRVCGKHDDIDKNP
ncbi:hypothetical protein [Janthinobacterium aquaticum]|uniref:hypothetical protein n=1 Tax=Janthinobacterium sp. FT58W TaxID=2654254 RepID=UPI0012646F6B|nr:hypothetical protein [Janthinobacterium sp. FT58W]KAB8036625.1 hypothetical protein GCM43_24320 [Janthinobacterium sp. FT58W]